MALTKNQKNERVTGFWLVIAIALGVIIAMVALIFGQSILVAAGAGLWVTASFVFGWLAALFQQDSNTERPITDPSEFAQEAGRDDSIVTDETTVFARLAIEATPNPVVIVDQAGRIITTNEAARVRFSIGHEVTRLNRVVRRPDLVEAVEATSRDRKPRSLSFETNVPVARYERVSVAAFAVNDRVYVLITILDETEARMSERMRADFLANASHELRTPLAAIIGFIETLRGPAKNDATARDRFLEVMHLQADRMSRLISDLLSLSRIELNEHVPPTARSDIANGTLETIDSLTPEKKKRVTTSIEKSPAWVLGDRDEMAQVLTNLIDNALKYSATETQVLVSVASSLTREEAIGLAMRQWPNAARLPLTSPELERNRRYSVIRVENEGVGIERQHLPRLSERFFRVDDLASGKSGTGLGLAIVKHIVSRHRGGLVVESEIGRGSAFAVYLPEPFEPDEPSGETAPTSLAQRASADIVT